MRSEERANALWADMHRSTEFRSLCFQHLASRSQQSFFRMPTPILTKAFQFFASSPDIQWALGLKLTYDLALSEGHSDWVAVAREHSVRTNLFGDETSSKAEEPPVHQVPVVEHVFLCAYSEAMKSATVGQRLYFLSLANLAADVANAGKDGGSSELHLESSDSHSAHVKKVDTSLLSTKITSLQFQRQFGIEHLQSVESVFETVVFRLRDEDSNSTEPDWATRVNARVKRIRLLRKLSKLMARAITRRSMIHPGAFKAFWELVIMVDSPIWARILEVSETAHENSCYSQTLLYELLEQFGIETAMGGDLEEVASLLNVRVQVVGCIEHFRQIQSMVSDNMTY